MNKIDIYSDKMSDYKDQIAYKDAFLKKFGDKIPSNDPFYFDDVDIIDENGETIRGISFGTDTWETITKRLIKYFHLDYL